MHTSPTASSTPEAEKSMDRKTVVRITTSHRPERKMYIYIYVAYATYFPAMQPMHMLVASLKPLFTQVLLTENAEKINPKTKQKNKKMCKARGPKKHFTECDRYYFSFKI